MILMVYEMSTGNKNSIAEPQNLVDAIKEALKDKKSIEAGVTEDDLKEPKRSKG